MQSTVINNTATSKITRGMLSATKPDMAAQCKKYRSLRKLCAVGVALCFVGFGVVGFVIGSFFFGPLFALIAVPFFGFIACGVGFMASWYKLTVCMQVNEIIQKIKKHDKILLVQLLPGFNESDLILLADKLISTGNIAEYIIVGDVMLVKENLYVSESEAKKEYDKYFGRDFTDTATSSQYGYCPSCGKSVSASDKYCSGCGRLLR